MKTIVKVSILSVGLTGIAGSAMADKTWTSDPSTYEPGWSQPDATQAPSAEPSYTPSKSYRLYKAAKAHAKSHHAKAR